MCDKSNNEHTDADLVESARQGNKQAFGELVKRHHHWCVGLASGILRDRGDAEDEAQNAYWNAFQHLDQYQGDAEFSTWLARIVVNQCLMFIRTASCIWTRAFPAIPAAVSIYLPGDLIRKERWAAVNCRRS
jgi:RNA polymerase sigma factor (sigma-70 family)